MTRRLFILFVFLLAPLEAQDIQSAAKTPPSPAAPPALYAIENVFPIVYTRNLVRITMDSEGKLSQKKLLSQDQYFFRSNDDHYKILGQHFLVTPYCGVIDLTTRQVISKEDDGEFLGEDGSNIYYRITRNAIRENGYFAFDLKTHEVAKIRPPWYETTDFGPHWSYDLNATLSPDKRMYVTSEENSIIRLHKIDGTTKDIAKGFTALTGGSSMIENYRWPLPFLWLENTRILTQKLNGKLVILNIDGTSENLLDVPGEKLVDTSRPRLWVDATGRIIYSACDQVYLIDPKEKRASLLQTYALGNGFEVSTIGSQEGLFSIFHDGKEIGKRNFCHDRAVTAPGLIAIPEVGPKENPNMPTDVAVWNAARNEWQSTSLNTECLVGWAP
jgi:hypothetical protein